MTRKFFVSLFVLAFFIVSPVVALGAEFAGGEEYFLHSGEKIEDNLYCGGGMVSVDGDVEGDLIVGGGNIDVGGNIHDDVLIGGGNITISGVVGGDLRVVGGEVKIMGTVVGEVVVVGGMITLASNAVVGKGMTFAGGKLLLNGEVTGDLEVYGGEIGIFGTVNGDVKSETDKLELGSKAVINGNLGYKAPNEVEMQDGAQVKGEIIYEKIESGKHGLPVNKKLEMLSSLFAKLFSIFWIIGLLVTLTSAIAIYKLSEKKTNNFVKDAYDNFGREFLRGLVIVIVVPVLIILLFVTVLGLKLGLMLLALFGLFLLLAKVGASILFGSLVFKFLSKSKKYVVDWKTITLGVVLLSFVKLIPIIGWLICGAFYLVAFGVLWMMLYKAFKK